MNAAMISSTGPIEENGNGSDSDANSDEVPEYYQPISIDDDDSDSESGHVNSANEHRADIASSYHSLTNGIHHVEGGIASVHIGNNTEQKIELDEEEEDEEERRIEASELAMRRALREDETRRNAPLTSENATRVMEAMRGISFGGEAPDWARQVPEDQWIDHLRRLRQPSGSTNTL